jgi:Protein of unknown function (DUF1168)
MSEPGKESIPTSADPRSKRPTKRRQLTPVSEQANQINVLFKDPSKEVRLAAISRPRTLDSLAPPPEIVANVQGSSAGAGSGEFHVYKASRRREYERLRLMDEESKREKTNEEFERQRAETQRKDEEKTSRNRRKREKRKAAAVKNKSTAMDVDGGENNNQDGEGARKNKAPRLGPLPPRGKNHDAGDYENGAEQQGHEEQGVIIHDDD